MAAENKKTKMKKIVIIGPESTGKSTLCTQLAAYFKTEWVKEYAREYLLTNGTDYKVEDLFTIAEGQIKNEETVSNTFPENYSGPFFLDTDFKVIQVWSEFVFNECDNRILKKVAKDNYHLYLLCNTDLPWVKDELREYPDLKTREELFHHYQQILIDQHVPWVLIKGKDEERLSIAIEAVNAIL